MKRKGKRRRAKEWRRKRDKGSRNGEEIRNKRAGRIREEKPREEGDGKGEKRMEGGRRRGG